MLGKAIKGIFLTAVIIIFLFTVSLIGFGIMGKPYPLFSDSYTKKYDEVYKVQEQKRLEEIDKKIEKQFN